jgi:ClpP class serine protease
MSFMDFFWLIILLASFQPWIKQRILEYQRVKLMQAIEKKRKSRVITLIHRQESWSFLGFAFAKYINIEDSEALLRAIRLTPDNMPIDLILHTPGGLVLAAEQIAFALMRHKAPVTVFVPHYAMSGGTFIALAADKIVMDENAVLGPVDPQLGEYPAASILKVRQEKPVEAIEDKTLILADVAQKAISQVRYTVKRILLAKHYDEGDAERIADILSSGYWTHDYPLTAEKAQSLGLPVSTDMLPEVHALMDLYPQSGQNRPSVNYIPVPYKSPAGNHGNQKE